MCEWAAAAPGHDARPDVPAARATLAVRSSAAGEGARARFPSPPPLPPPARPLHCSRAAAARVDIVLLQIRDFPSADARAREQARWSGGDETGDSARAE